MKLAARYLKHYKVQAVMAPLFKMLEAIFELLVPLVVAKMIDDGIGQGDRGMIYAMGGVLLLLALVGFGSSVTAQYFSAVAAAGVGKELRFDLFRHINRLTYRELDRLGTSTDRRKYGAPSVPSLTVHRLRCGDHGLYGGCENSHGIPRGTSTAHGCGLYHHICIHSSL